MTEKKKTGFALLTPEQRSEIAKRGAASRKASGRVGHRWTADEARAHGPQGARACREQGKRHAFTKEDMAKSSARFTSETARAASERRHDIAAQNNPNVEWCDDGP